jgi:hypothetical protein
MPPASEARNTSPVALHECTSKPMILNEYHTTRRADMYLTNIFLIQPAKIQIKSENHKSLITTNALHINELCKYLA